MKTVREAWDAFWTGASQSRDLILEYWEDDEPDMDEDDHNCQNMDFSEALSLLFQGYDMTRCSWDRVYIAHEQTDHPVYAGYQINLHTLNGKVVPWCPIQRDLLATDWMIVPDDEE